MGDMLSMAMIISFLTAPVFSWLNYRIMFGSNVPEAFRPSITMQWLSISGIIFLAGFGLVFLYWYFLMG
jgi:Mn2+/Fe2+ NRAMP family transporter